MGYWCFGLVMIDSNSHYRHGTRRAVAVLIIHVNPSEFLLLRPSPPNQLSFCSLLGAGYELAVDTRNDSGSCQLSSTRGPRRAHARQ